MHFSVVEGRNLNVLFQDRRLNVHVLWRLPSPNQAAQRLQFCFPEGNCGVGVDLSGRLRLEEAVTSWGKAGGLRGAQVRLEAWGAVVLGGACLDSLRALRDTSQPEAHEHRRQVRRDAGFVEPSWRESGPRVWRLRTKGLAGRWTMVLEVELPVGVDWREAGEGIVLQGPEAPWTLILRAGHDHPSLHPLGEERLLSARAQAWLESLAEGEERRRALKARRHLAFLSFEEKLLAGSWRFLTYFGRDSLLTSLLLGSTASLPFHEAAIGSVLARLSPDGRVAHEEDIGEQSAYRYWEENPTVPEAWRSGEPVYDYKMVDDDFLLLPALHALSRHPEAAGWWPRFRSQHQRALEANVQWCLGRLSGLVGLDHEVVGDWRDSEWGLGGGHFPYSVNVGLVPAFLDALDWFRGQGEVRLLWAEVPKRFVVHLTPTEIRRRLSLFLNEVPASTLEGAWYRSRDLGGVTVEQWLGGEHPVPRLDRGLSFSALALDRQGHAIEVLHSDLSFRLFLAEPPIDELEASLTLLELPYPIGLAHPVGFLVANAALSDRPELWHQLGRQGYHGAVVWSWQDAMITLGLRRQRRRSDLPPSVQDRLAQLLQQAAAQRMQAGEFVSSELWSWTLAEGRAVPVAYGEGEGDETESNAIQLWSSATLALADPRD